MCRTSLSKHQWHVNGQALTSRFCYEFENDSNIEAGVNAKWAETMLSARVFSSFSIISTGAKT